MYLILENSKIMKEIHCHLLLYSDKECSREFFIAVDKNKNFTNILDQYTRKMTSSFIFLDLWTIIIKNWTKIKINKWIRSTSWSDREFI